VVPLSIDSDSDSDRDHALIRTSEGRREESHINLLAANAYFLGKGTVTRSSCVT